MSKRKITRKELKTVVELLERPPIDPCSVTDEALIRQVMAATGWDYEQARERLLLSGM